MTTMSPEERERIRAAANATTGPSPDVMPTWVHNKPACRWAWENWRGWRRMVETEALSPKARANLVSSARVVYAAELRRRQEADLAHQERMRAEGRIL